MVSGPLHRPVGGGDSVPRIPKSAMFDGVSDEMAFTTTSHSTTRLTLALWVQKAAASQNMGLIGLGDGSALATPNNGIWFSNDDVIFYCNGLAATVADVRDTNGFYHLVLSIDLTASGTAKGQCFINGEEISTFDADARASWGTSFNNTAQYDLGALFGAGYFTNGYIAQAVFLDGQSIQNGDVTINDLGETYTANGVTWWRAKSNEDVASLASAAGGNSACLGDSIADGTDDSTNGNNFTTAMTDAVNGSGHTPSDTHCLLNPLDLATTGTLSDGNLTVAGGNATLTYRPTDDGTVYYYEKDGVAQTTNDPAALVLTAGTYNFGATAFAGAGPTGAQKTLNHGRLNQITIPASPDTGSFTANNNADGPYVYLGYAPSEDDALTIDGNAVTWGTHADALNAGFKMRTNAVGYNDGTGTKNWSLVTTNAAVTGRPRPPLPAGDADALEDFVGPIAPTITTDPTLSGTVEIGQTLTATPGTVNGTLPITSTFEFRHSDNTVIQADSGTTTYVIQASDYNKQIKVVQTATGQATPNATRESSLTVAVPGIAPNFNGNAPTVSTTAKVGNTISSVTGATGITGTPTPTNDTPAFTLRDKANIGTIVSSDPASYTWQAGDEGKTFIVRQSISNAVQSGVTADSADIGPVAAADAAPSNTVAPVLSTPGGSTTVGVVVTCSTGTWDDNGQAITGYSYQWKKNAANVGTDQNTYDTSGDADTDVITCEVSATNSVGTGGPVTASNNVTLTAGGGSPWAPADLGAKLLGHWDATDNTTVTTSGGSVSAWADKTAAGRDFVQAVGADQPTHVAGSYIDFTSNTSEHLTIATLGALGGSSISYYAVVRMSDFDSANRHHLFSDEDWTHVALVSHNNGGTPQGAGWTTATFYQNGTDTGWTDRAVVATELLTNADELIGFVGGDNSAWANLTLHNLPSNSFDSGMRMYELIITDGTETTDERQDIEGYLAHKFGIQAKLPDGHPHKASPP